MKASCDVCGQPHPRCNGHKDNAPCGRWPTRGAQVCRSHGAGNPRIKAAAAVRHEVAKATRNIEFGLGTVDIEPGEVLLRLLSQAVARAERFATEIAHMVDEHGFAEAFVGDVLVIDPQSGAQVKVNEYIRGLAQLENTERDRAAKFAKLALDAGIAERQVKLAERQGAIIERVLLAAFEGLQLTDAQRAEAPAAIRRALEAVA